MSIITLSFLPFSIPTDITFGEYHLDLIPFDDDVLSLELDTAYKECFLVCSINMYLILYSSSIYPSFHPTKKIYSSYLFITIILYSLSLSIYYFIGYVVSKGRG